MKKEITRCIGIRRVDDERSRRLRRQLGADQ